MLGNHNLLQKLPMISLKNHTNPNYFTQIASAVSATFSVSNLLILHNIFVYTVFLKPWIEANNKFNSVESNSVRGQYCQYCQYCKYEILAISASYRFGLITDKLWLIVSFNALVANKTQCKEYFKENQKVKIYFQVCLIALVVEIYCDYLL